MLKVINVAGARPNFMKVAPIVAAMNRRTNEFRHVLVHTGQHYDSAMSHAFFAIWKYRSRTSIWALVQAAMPRKPQASFRRLSLT